MFVLTICSLAALLAKLSFMRGADIQWCGGSKTLPFVYT
jgi:hypothetical protein